MCLHMYFTECKLSPSFTFSGLIALELVKTDGYCQQQKCIPWTLVSDDIRSARMLRVWFSGEIAKAAIDLPTTRAVSSVAELHVSVVLWQRLGADGKPCPVVSKSAFTLCNRLAQPVVTTGWHNRLVVVFTLCNMLCQPVGWPFTLYNRLYNRVVQPRLYNRSATPTPIPQWRVP